MSAAERIAAVEARRTARKADQSAARDEQCATDMEALDALEVEHGDSGVARLDVERYVKGHPTFVVLRTPDASQYKRFCDMVARASKTNDQKARQEAQNLLAKSCWCYPPAGATQDAMLAEFPGLLLSIAIRATKLVEAEEAEAGKD